MAQASSPSCHGPYLLLVFLSFPKTAPVTPWGVLYGQLTEEEKAQPSLQMGFFFLHNTQAPPENRQVSNIQPLSRTSQKEGRNPPSRQNFERCTWSPMLPGSRKVRVASLHQFIGCSLWCGWVARDLEETQLEN